jgi:hypothetical protein
MKITTLSPVTIANAQDPLATLHQAIQPDTTISLPIETPEQVKAAKQFAQAQPVVQGEPHPDVPKFNLFFDNSPQSLAARKVLEDMLKKAAAMSAVPAQGAPKAVAAPPRTPSSFTIAQGAKGGATIGGIAGAGAFMLAEDLRQQAVAIGDPICAAVGMVLAGVAAGAAAGAGFAKYLEVTVKVSSTQVQFKAT